MEKWEKYQYFWTEKSALTSAMYNLTELSPQLMAYMHINSIALDEMIFFFSQKMLIF